MVFVLSHLVLDPPGPEVTLVFVQAQHLHLLVEVSGLLGGRELLQVLLVHVEEGSAVGLHVHHQFALVLAHFLDDALFQLLQTDLVLHLRGIFWMWRLELLAHSNRFLVRVCIQVESCVVLLPLLLRLLVHEELRLVWLWLTAEVVREPLAVLEHLVVLHRRVHALTLPHGLSREVLVEVVVESAASKLHRRGVEVVGEDRSCRLVGHCNILLPLLTGRLVLRDKR